MAREQRLDPEVEVIWEDFHAEVNIPSAQLRQWLLTRGSGEEAFGPDPDLDLPEPGGPGLLSPPEPARSVRRRT